MLEKMTAELAEKYNTRTPIAPDDPTAVSSAPGWAAHLARCGPPTAASTPDVPGGLFWAASLKGSAFDTAVRLRETETAKGRKPPPEPRIGVAYFECERAADVRKVAEVLLGGDVDVFPVAAITHKPLMQIRWTGSAMGDVNLRREIREVDGAGGVGKWRDQRSL